MTGTSNRTQTGTTSVVIDARQAYDQGMPLHIVRRRYHLSEGEAREVAPEEFGDDVQPDSVSGY